MTAHEGSAHHVRQDRQRWLSLLTANKGAVIKRLVSITNDSLDDDLIEVRWACAMSSLNSSLAGPLSTLTYGKRTGCSAHGDSRLGSDVTPAVWTSWMTS